MEVSFTCRFNACEAFTAYSTACRFSTGSAPGIPRHTGHTLLLGSEPKTLGQPQKILLLVSSCTCTSRPITVSYLDSTFARLLVAIAMVLRLYVCRCRKCAPHREDEEPGAPGPAPRSFAALTWECRMSS